MINNDIKSILAKKIKKDSKLESIDYINLLKGTIYYIGKVIFLLYNDIVDKDSKNLVAIIDEVEIKKNLPDIFDKMERVYNTNEFLLYDDKRDILNIILKYNVKDIRKLSLGDLYETFITSKERKELGQVYTPKEIVVSMIDEGIKTDEIINNPYYKIIDPACGGGYFLIEAYNKLYNIFSENYEKIININDILKKDFEHGIHRFIIENNLWGRDIDSFAIFMTIYSLIIKDEYNKEIVINIIEGDALLDGDYSIFSMLDSNKHNHLENDKFDLVIGNPPYIGHKKIDKDYKIKLKKHYADVYNDKSDISYCFFKRGYELLKKGGKLLLITSRYFLESPSGRKLRIYLKENYHIDLLIDYYGYRVFKGIGVSPIIIKCIKDECVDEKTHIYKLNRIDKSIKENLSINNNNFDNFYVSKENFRVDSWMLMKDDEINLFRKIDSLGNYYLRDICDSNQGIISGCDKAFIVDKDVIEKENLETEVIKPWIKSRHIKKYNLSSSNLFIIYTDIIDDINKYPNILKHVLPYCNKLYNRRECKKGIRKWYELQWGRNLDIFRSPKIIFPYKAKDNKFVLVCDEVLFSADIYMININKDKEYEIPIEYLLGFLNSSIFSFYFKSVGKKLDESQYDYYPNKIMNLKIKVGNDKSIIVNSVNKLMNHYKELKNMDRGKENYDTDYNSEKTVNDIKYEIDNINDYFYDLYNLNSNEKEIINKILK